MINATFQFLVDINVNLNNYNRHMRKIILINIS